jgi:hypothetical protein
MRTSAASGSGGTHEGDTEMIGNNELLFNQATMVEALQMYLNASMVNSPTVVSVSKHSSNGGVEEFSIKVEGPSEPK